jgi:hypothetical protein
LYFHTLSSSFLYNKGWQYGTICHEKTFIIFGEAQDCCYNNAKQKKPDFSRGEVSVCRYLFNSFSPLKGKKNRGIKETVKVKTKNKYGGSGWQI